MKNYKNFCIYDFSDYAEEITGDELFKINGGAEVENSHEGVAGANVGDTITRNDGTVVVLNQGDINYANEQLGKKANTETGSENKPDLILNDYGESASQTTDSIPDVLEEIKSNPHALAYYMAKQGQAIAEGNSDKYKGYNVLGGESIGLTKLTPFKLLNEVIGQSGTDIWKSVPKHTLSVDGRSGSFPIIGICYDSETMENPLNDVNTFVHEVFHQVQYNNNKNSFGALISEFLLNEKKSIFDNIYNYTYDYDKDNLEKYQSLSDLPYLESQAQFVGDYGSFYYKSRYGTGVTSYEEKLLHKMVGIMKNSGYGDTEAVKWIEN